MTRTYQDFFSLFREWSEKDDLWDLLKKSNLPIYIYGMGNGADRLAERLKSIGLHESGYFASDAFVRGQFFRGFQVESFSSILAREEKFIALLAFGSRLPEVIRGFQVIQKTVPFYVPDLPLIGEEYFDRTFLSAHLSSLATACHALADTSSRDLFCALVQYKLTGDLSLLLKAVDPQMPPFRLGEEETIVDLGAYTGDSIESFRALFPGIRNYVAVEADEKSFRKLENFGRKLEAEGILVRAYHGAAGAEEGIVSFFSSGNRNSSRSNPSHEKKKVSVPLRTVDQICAGCQAGLIKFDVEGMEREALVGCFSTLRRCRPALKLSVYHRSEDLFRLLLLCREEYPKVRFYLRRTPCVPAWEADLYVIPEERSL